MLKQSPSRNQRSKGFKVKHAVQICLLLAICIWLLYQIKHSHEKKVAYEQSSPKISEKVQTNEIIKLGRKDLHPRVEETALETERREGKEELEESKPEEIEDEGSEGREDGIDDLDQERAEEEEPEEVEDLIDVEDKEREEEDSEEEGDQNENGVSLENQAQTGSERISQEAGEERYKRDDASRVVLQDTQTITSQFEIGGLRKVEEVGEIAEKIEVDLENDINGIEMVVDIKDSGLKAGNRVTAENGAFGKDLHGAGKRVEFKSASSNVGLKKSTSSLSIKSKENEQSEVKQNSILMPVEPHSYLNRRDILLESIHRENATQSNSQAASVERYRSSNRSTGYDQTNFNLTLSTNDKLYGYEKQLAVSSGSQPAVLDQNVDYDAAAITGEGSISTATNEIDGADYREESNEDDH